MPVGTIWSPVDTAMHVPRTKTKQKSRRGRRSGSSSRCHDGADNHHRRRRRPQRTNIQIAADLTACKTRRTAQQASSPQPFDQKYNRRTVPFKDRIAQRLPPTSLARPLCGFAAGETPAASRGVSTVVDAAPYGCTAPGGPTPDEG